MENGRYIFWVAIKYCRYGAIVQNGYEVLLDVWREVCRHVEIVESTRNITMRLQRFLPLREIVVRRYDPAERALDTVAVGRLRGLMPSPRQRTVLPESAVANFMEWVGGNSPLVFPVSAADPLQELLPADLVGSPGVLAEGLHTPGGCSGMLLLTARPSQTFCPSHLEIVRALAEPFSAAIENDRRMHELTALREAAEAERRRLASRLRSGDVSDVIVGANTGLRQVMERVDLVSHSDVPVLILGETGTGKEVVARAIHVRSKRAAGPFLRVNCGAIPSELVDSQLFGHEKGSFTGAADLRRGWFERADGGTLFLDEIGELPLAAQVRLLRVLQDGYMERVGGHEPIQVNVRIVAATHRDLAAMVHLSQFREDLWYRVNVFPILLPGLRERIEDIPALARYFAERAADRFGLPMVEPSPAELQLLANYDWPGNIRELGAVMDRAVILGNGQRLEVAAALGSAALPPNSRDPERPSAPPQMPATELPESPSPRAVAPLASAMRAHIERALIASRGRIEGRGGAAELLAVNPHTLRARMRKLRIDWVRFRSS